MSKGDERRPAWPERSRLLAFGGVVGPAAFVGAWSLLGVTARDYSPVHDPISRLAAVGASTRPAMTAGMVAFGIGLPLYAVGLRRALPGPAWVTAAIAGMATLGVAAFPLDGPGGDVLRGALAAGAYGSVAATPLLAGRPMKRLGRPGWAAASLTAGCVSAALLAATTLDTLPGLFQRLGLTVADAWIVASAVDILRER